MNVKYLLSSLIITLALIAGFGPSARAADACSAASFKVSSSLSLEWPPYGIASADFNGDGHLDLAVTSNNSNEVLIFKGGPESFGPQVGFPAGTGPESVGVGDFNGDGKPDLVITNNTFGVTAGKVAVLLNDGSGNFGPPTITVLTASPSQPSIADLNNDGKLDLVVGLYTGVTGGKIEILLSDGAGGFTKPANSAFFPDSTNPGGAKVGDFNEDGNKDIVSLSNSRGLDVFLGDGTGGFTTKVNSPGNNDFLYSLTVADLNGDGHLDALAGTSLSNNASNIYLLMGNGAGTFAAPTVINVPLAFISLAARDLNNDAQLDLVITGLAGVKVMLADGAGSFTALKTYAAGPQLVGPAFGDFNEDGKVDIAVGQGLTGTSYSVELLYGDGAGAFTAPLGFSTSIARPRELVAADFNNDGKQDFAAVSGENLGSTQGASSVEVALGDGNGNFADKSVIRFFSGTLLSSIAAADFNKDGYADLAVTLPFLSKVAILLNDGMGGFSTSGFTAPSFATNPYGFGPTRIKSGDFNNDTKPDLVVLTPNSNNFILMLGDGAGSFTTTQGQPEGSPRDLAVADFNNDGKLDVVTSGASGDFARVSMFLGTGGGGFTNVNQFEFQQSYLVSLLAADLNNDGKPDLAVTSSNIQGKFLTIILGNGTGGLISRTNYAVEGAGILGLGDFNGDGQPDLAVGGGQYIVGGSLAGISILTNDGAGAFAPPVTFNAGHSSDYLIVRDFNSDGKDDVLFAQPNANSLALLLNNFSVARQCLSVNDVTVTEGDAGTTDAVFTVKLSSASTQTVRVNYFFEAPFQNGGQLLKKGVDFEAVPGTLIFAPGVTTQSVSVPVKGDMIDEFDEFFNLRLSTAVNAFISDAKGVGTIVDNDPSPSLSINDVTVAETSQTNSSSAVLTVSLSVASEKPVTMQYALSAGTATPNNDYFNASGSVEIPAGTTSKTISIPVVPDSAFEPDETFFVNLTNIANATVADAQAQVTILNDDPVPTISMASTTSFVSEATSPASRQATINVTMSNPSYQPVTVNFSTIDGTATAGVDYQAVAGTLTFNPGELPLTKSIIVPFNDDALDEINETFIVKLTDPTNALLGNAQTTVTISDNDGPKISINDISIREGSGITDANFTVSLSAISPQDVTVEYSTANGTARSGSDYVGQFRRSLTIPAGTQSQTIAVQIIGDNVAEGDETFLVNLSGAFNGTIDDGQGVCTILDETSSLQFSQSTYSVAENTGFINVTVTRAGDKSLPATVKYSTSDLTDANFQCNPNTAAQITGVASRKCDYHISVGTLRFAAGEESKQFTLSIVNDVYVEGPETFILTLSAPVGAKLGQDNTVPVIITDDDLTPAANPLEQTSFFVRQLYVDLLSREPDPAGWQGWTTRIDQCGQPGQPPPPCDRVTVGGDGFLRSGEFFDRQFFVLRLYRTGLGRILRYEDVADLAYVSGFLTTEQLELNKQDLVAEIMARAEFAGRYNGLGNDLFVDTLLQTAAVTVPDDVRQGWIAALGGGTKTRAQVYREISERQEVSNKYLHEAQVVSAYYGFFTRNPDGAYLNYLQRLDSGEINLSDLANAFINAQEYRQRFGQ